MSSPPDHQCECVIPAGEKTGWCERHGMFKTAHWIELCRTRPSYRKRWEEGRGPGQDIPDRITSDKNRARELPDGQPGEPVGVGSMVRKALGCSAGSGSSAVFAEMNDLGLGCVYHLERLAKEVSRVSRKRCGGISPKSAERLIHATTHKWNTLAQPQTINCDTHGFGDCVTAAWVWHGAKDAGVPLSLAATGERAKLLRIFGVEPVEPSGKMLHLSVPHFNDRAVLADGTMSRPQAWITSLPLPTFQPLRPTLHLSDETKQRVQLEKPYVLLCPQSHHANREWSIPLWRELARRMELDRYNVYFLGEHRADCLDLPNWISSDDWEYSTALLSQASLVVGVDSAPVNVAGTCGVPIVAILGPTTVDALAHLGKAHWVTPPPQAIHCVGCWFNAPHYTAARCKASCAAMTVNSMMTVMGVIWSTGVRGRAQSNLQSPPDDVSVLNCSMHGFGDTLVAAWLAYGTQEYEQKIGLHAHNRRAEMIELFGLTNYAMRPADQQSWREKLFNKGMAFADRKSQGYPPRLWLWANYMKLDMDLIRPQHNLTRQEQRSAINADSSNSVLFFRESTDGPRFWIDAYWDELQEELEKRGYDVLNCGQAEGRHFFADHRAMAAGIVNACLVVGVDSGPVHLAGTLNIPTVSLHGVTSPSVFAHMPNVRALSVDARELPCVRCYYNTWMYDTACNYTCAAMATLTSDRVLPVCLEALE